MNLTPRSGARIVRRAAGLAGALILIAAGTAGAQESVSSRAAACGVCHGGEGSSPDQIAPDLAGQNAGYLALQLRRYRDGERRNDAMSPFADGLSDAEIDALAAHYAALPREPEPAADAATLATGRNLAAVCIACHGMRGVTANPEWPNLAGQNPGYLVQRLRSFRDADPYNPIMTPLVTGYTDAQFEALAAWFSQLAP